MNIRVQPREIEVPQGSPFEYDLLKRQEPVEILTRLLGSLDGPCVLAVDAGWGAGKTTFLRMWAAYLRNETFPIVEFNAWKTDFAADPFAALSAEITASLSEYKDTRLQEKLTDIRRKAKEVLRRSIPGVVRLATAGLLDVQPLMEKEVGDLAASLIDDRLSEYDKLRSAIGQFKEALKGMADTLAESRQNRPLVIFVDELDRCRPSYAVELLEIAKHFFSVDRVVFVLAVNRSQLRHSVQALYGHSFDADGYLRRFFDVDFVLPSPDRRAFVDAVLKATGIDQYFERTQDKHWIQEARNLLCQFLCVLDISIRDISQAIHRLGLVLASLPSDKLAFAPAIVVLLVLRVMNEQLYHSFVRGDITDIEVANAVFRDEQTRDLRWESEGLVFEATLIGCWLEMARNRPREEGVASPLQKEYRDTQQQYQEADQVGKDHELDEREAKRATRVLKIVEWLSQGYGYGTVVGFHYSVQRLELLSAEIVAE